MQLRKWTTPSLALIFLAVGCSASVDPGAGGDGSMEPDLSVPGGGGGDLSAAIVDMSGAPRPDGPTCITNLASIALAPANSTVTLSGGAPAPVQFTATGTFKDSHTAALDPRALGWSVTRGDDTPPGSIVDGAFTPFAQAGGVVHVTATDGCVSGGTDITLNLQVTVGKPVDPTPWAMAPTAGLSPIVVYPSDQTRFPRNIYRTLFQWRTQGYKEFRLTFEGQGAKVVVFTDGVHALCAGKSPAAGCWEADQTAWSYIAASNAGGTVTWTLDALDTTVMPAKIRRATPITLGFSKRDVAGAIFYWSTTSAGIRRANIADAVPEDYMTGKPGTVYPNDQVACVACHVVSRDGKYLIAPVQSQKTKSLWVTEVTRFAPPKPLVTSVANTSGHGFATISPDDSMVVSAFNNILTMVDRASGNVLMNLPLGNLTGTHPDWSPDNSQLVFATGGGDAPGNASLATIPWNKPGWGAPKTIVPAGGKSNLFPMFSPDGKWIAYSRGKGGHGDVTAQLFATDSAGAKQIELINANRVSSNVMTLGQFENSQPTWAPSGDFEWVAFNSVREYGVVAPKGTQQIWVAAVDKSKLAQGIDGSYPAFRLQFQGLAENNHRAFWTLDVRDTEPPPDGGVPPDMSTPRDMSMTSDGGPDMAQCIANGATCDPVYDRCCSNGFLCDTSDNGMTYTCVMGIM